jgi:ATP-dependent DNA helicase RecG
MPELDSEALDFRAASELFAPPRNLRKSNLHTLRLLTTYQGRKVPPVGGVLLFGCEREPYFPDAWIQAGRFHGERKTLIADSSEIRSLPVMVISHKLDQVFRISNRISVLCPDCSILLQPDREDGEAVG